MAKQEIVYLRGRGFDSLIMPPVDISIPMPPGAAIPVQFSPTHPIRVRSSYGVSRNLKRNRTGFRLRSK